MRHLRCSYTALMELPVDYVEIVVEESKREADEQKQAARGRRRR